MTTSSPSLAPGTSIDREVLTGEIARRRDRLTAEMAERGLDALLLASEGNAVYATGYETTFWVNRSKPFIVIMDGSGQTTVVCHVGEAPSVELDAVDTAVRPYVGPDAVGEGADMRLDYQHAATAAAAAQLRELGAERVGAELSWHFDPGLTPDAWQELRQLAAPATLRDASAAIWSVRRVKSEWEVAHMREAAEILERGHQTFADNARVGMTERQLSRLLAHSLIECGGERVPYTGVIAGLDRAPLGGPTDRPWEAGQMLGVDMCPRNGGYWADFCRIYASEEPTAAQRDAYARLVDALEAARAVLRAGTPVSEIATALLVTGDNPYARAGHGLGLDMPEPPSISPLDETPLRAGEVICLEPNIQVEGVGWLTAEEEVLVTDSGWELLSPTFPAELRVIGCP